MLHPKTLRLRRPEIDSSVSTARKYEVLRVNCVESLTHIKKLIKTFAMIEILFSGELLFPRIFLLVIYAWQENKLDIMIKD